MKILHITINQLKFERRIQNQVKSGIDHSFQISVMHLIADKNIKGDDQTDFTDIPVYSPFYKGGPLKFLHFNWQVFRIGKKGRYDILHAHDLWILPAAALLSRKFDIKLVYDAHEFYSGLEIFKRRRFRRWIWMKVEHLCMRHVNQSITVSEPLADLYKELYDEQMSIEVIRNVPEYEIPTSEKTEKISIDSKMLTLLFHGHFRPGRGLLNLMHAVSHVPDVQLIMIGGGELEAELKTLSKDLDISDRVIFKSYIPVNHLISTAAQADMGVVLFEPDSANYAHALPNKFFEYIMAGLPVLASHIDTLEYYIGQYQIGICADPADIRDLTNVIKDIAKNRDQLKDWHLNAKSAAKELNWNNEAKKLLELYEKITK